MESHISAFVIPMQAPINTSQQKEILEPTTVHEQPHATSNRLSPDVYEMLEFDKDRSDVPSQEIFKSTTTSSDRPTKVGLSSGPSLALGVMERAIPKRNSPFHKMWDSAFARPDREALDHGSLCMKSSQEYVVRPALR